MFSQSDSFKNFNGEMSLVILSKLSESRGIPGPFVDSYRGNFFRKANLTQNYQTYSNR